MMKRIIMYLLGTVTVLTLGACTPTTEKQAETATTIEESTGGVSDKVPDPNVEPLAIVSVFTPNKNATGLVQEMDGITELDAEHLLEKMIEYGVLEEDTKVLGFEMKDGIGTLNLSNVPSSLGTSGETLMLASIGNTFIQNFELDSLKLLVDGKNYESGHIEHSDSDQLIFVKEFKEMLK